jgi:Na+/proline symporter
MCAISFLFISQLKQKPSDFILGDENPPTYLVACSFFSFFSIIGFLSALNIGKSLFLNIFSFTSISGIVLATFLTYRYLVPWHRSHFKTHGCFSLYSILEDRLGSGITRLSAVFYCLTQFSRVLLIIFLLRSVINILPREDMKLIFGSTTLALNVYICWGGMRSFLVTCFVQTIAIFVSCSICCFYLLSNVSLASLKLVDFTIQTPTSFAFLPSTLMAVYLTVGVASSFVTYQHYYVRYLIASDTKKAQKSSLIGGWLLIVGSLMFVIFGTSVGLFFRSNSLEKMTPRSSATCMEAWSLLMTYELPAGIKGLLVIIAVCLSTNALVVSLHGLATVYLENFYKPYCKKRAIVPSNKKSVNVLKSCLLAVGVGGILLSFVPKSRISIDSLQWYWQFVTPFDTTLLSLFVLFFLGKKLRSSCVLIGITVGWLVSFWTIFSSVYGIWCPMNEGGGFFVSIAACCATTYCLQFASRVYKVPHS